MPWTNLLPLAPYLAFLAVWAAGSYALWRIESSARAQENEEQLSFRLAAVKRREDRR